jgi:hypothetical protein
MRAGASVGAEVQRTRRRKRWAVVAVGLLLSAYGASVWPRVSASNFAGGWAAAVPTPVLIASMRWMPAEAGSLPDRNSPQAAAIPYRQRAWSERFGSQIKTRMYKPESTTRLDRWLFFRAARGETAEVLTEPTAVRGDVYRYVVNAWLRQGRVSGEEERWARSVHQVRAEHAEYALDRWPTYARVQIRRLAEGAPWRVRIGETLSETKTRNWPAGRDRFEDLRPVDLPVYGWWDGNVLIDRHMYTVSGFATGPPPTTFTRTIAGRIFEGDRQADVWWPVAEVSHDIAFKIATRSADASDGLPGGPAPRTTGVTGYEVVDDEHAARMIDWLKRSIRVDFVRGERTWPRWTDEGLPDRMKLSIKPGHAAPADLPAFTFGGNVTVVLRIRRGGGDPDNPKIVEQPVFEFGPAWWALRDDLDHEGRRVLEHAWKGVPLRHDERFAGLRDPLVSGFLPLAQNDVVIGGVVEIRFGTNRLGNEGFRALADLEAERILTHTVRIPIEHGSFQTAPAFRYDGVRLEVSRPNAAKGGPE